MLSEAEHDNRKEYFKRYTKIKEFEGACLVKFETPSENYPRKALIKYSPSNNHEAQISKLFSESSKFFVMCYGYLYPRPNSDIEIIFEYCEKGSLRKKLKNCITEEKLLNKEMVLFQFANLAEAMHNSHKSLAHRDIKPDNIFITSNNIFKIGDFDISSFKQNSELTAGKKGTPFYMPVKYTDNAIDKNDLLKIDIHSFIKTFAEVINPIDPNSLANWFGVFTKIDKIGFQQDEIDCLNSGFNCSSIIEFSNIKNILKSVLKRNFSNMTEVNYTCYVCGECAFDNNFIMLTDQCKNHVAHVKCFSGYWNCTDNHIVCPICDVEIDVNIIEGLNNILKFNLEMLDD